MRIVKHGAGWQLLRNGEPYFIKGAVAEHDVTALKIKIGYLMFMTADMYDRGPIGKTERLIPMIREAFPNLTLYADANSYYDVEGAIRIGRILEDCGARDTIRAWPGGGRRRSERWACASEAPGSERLPASRAAAT